MNITRRQILLIIVLALALLVTDFCVELLAPDVADWLKNQFGEGYKIRLWLLLPLAVIASLLIGNWQDWFKKEQVSASIESNTAKLIEELKRKYKKRIESKLLGRFPVNLRIVTSGIGTSEEGRSNFITLQEKEVSREIGEIFDRAGGRLLVVGLPGAGKTTLLLQLALELLKRAENVAHLEGVPHFNPPIPILLNLATWRTGFGTFEEWLRRILPNELGVSGALAEKIRANNRLILLLDGFDEVPEEDRNSCLEAIGIYGMMDENQYVISTRILEYAAAIDAKNINHQVEVAPLDAEQIEINLAAQAYKSLPGAGAKALYNCITGKDPQDALLKQAIENPFYLNTAQLLFASGKKWSEFGFAADDVAGRKRELVKQFVEYVLGHSVKRNYPVRKVEKWLVFLATKMEEDGLRKFELGNIWAGWVWNKKWWYEDAWQIIAMLLRIVFWCIFWPFTLVFITSIVIIIWAFIAGLPILSTFEAIYFFGKFFGQGFLQIGMVWGGVWGWTYIIILIYLQKGYTVYEILKYSRFFLFFILAFSAFCFIKGGLLIFTCAIAFFLPMHFILWLQIRALLRFRYFLKLDNPYQRHFASLLNLEVYVLDDFILISLLFLKSSLPFRLVYFLNEMSRRHLLEFDGDLETESGGGAWRWRHRIIQEYFLKEKE